MLEVLGEDFGEIGRRRHDKALVVARPRNQVLYTGVFQHVVQLVDEGCLYDFRLL